MLQFRRITTQKRFIPQIDGLRFVAIASVVFFHIYAAFEIGAVPPTIPLDTDMPKHGVEKCQARSQFEVSGNTPVPEEFPPASLVCLPQVQSSKLQEVRLAKLCFSIEMRCATG